MAASGQVDGIERVGVNNLFLAEKDEKLFQCRYAPGIGAM